MAENEVIENETTVEEDYIQTIQDLKASTVSKESYNQLKQEHQRLLKSIANGDELVAAAAEQSNKDVATLRKELFSNGEGLSNLDYVKGVLELRDAIIDQGGYDPFLPSGSKCVPTSEDIAEAEKVAQVFQDCVDYANGDSEVFTNELMRRTVDTMPTLNKRRR